MDKKGTDQNLEANANQGFHFHDAPEHPILIAVYAYWKRLAGDREMPHYADIDPIEIPSLMPHVMIGEILDRKNMKIRIRLFGTALTHVTGEDRTGVLLEENRSGDKKSLDQQAFVNRWRFVALKCVNDRCPIFTTRTHSDPDRDFLTTHTAVFPLMGSNGEIERIFAAMTTVSAPQS